VTVDGQCWLIDIDGQLQNAADIGASFAATEDNPLALQAFSADGGSSDAGTLTVRGNAGTVQFGDSDTNVGAVEALVKIEGNVNRIDLYGGSTATGTIGVDGNLGRQYSRKRGGRRRWYTEGLSSDGHLAGAVTVDGQAWLIDIDGQLQGAVEVGDAFTATDVDPLALQAFSADGGSSDTGTLTVHGNAGTVQFGDSGTNVGAVDALVKIKGNVNRIDLYGGSTASGTIDVDGNLGRQYSRKRGGRRRWYTEGLSCGGHLAGAVTVGGKAWQIIVDDEVQSTVEVGDVAGGDLGYFSCAGTMSADLTVHGDLGQAHIGGNLTASITAEREIGYWYRRRRNGRRVWREVGVTVAGWLIGDTDPAVKALNDSNDKREDGFMLVLTKGAKRDDDVIKPGGTYYVRPALTLYWDEAETIELAECL